MSHSRIPGFHRLCLHQRHATLKERFGLSDSDLAVLSDGGCLGVDCADKMVENCVGVLGMPIGLGLNFSINGKDYGVPMAIEEASVVAAVSNVARIVRQAGGFTADADPSTMIGQLQLLDVPDMVEAERRLIQARDDILALANTLEPRMRHRGGGATAVEVRALGAPWPMLVVHLLVDCVDAMGANTVNTMVEGVAPLIERISGGRVNLRILSNLADRRRARAECKIPYLLLGGKGFAGDQVAEDIVQAYRFASMDPYRAATHNKGIMNGIDAVAIATGNDWRSLEAGAHAFAARGGRYKSLTRWWHEDGCLRGSIELPMAVGTVGGATRIHPTLEVCRKILGVEGARELAGVMAAVGLAQNLGALRALASEGIQRGHMALHARAVALEAGAPAERVDEVARALVAHGDIKVEVAQALLAGRTAGLG